MTADVSHLFRNDGYNYQKPHGGYNYPKPSGNKPINKTGKNEIF